MVTPNVKLSIKMSSTVDMTKIILIETTKEFMGKMAQIQHILEKKTSHCQNIIISFSRLPNDKCIKALSKPSYARSPL
jgi:hypothetical protein